jgi:serine/threonine protein kinase
LTETVLGEGATGRVLIAEHDFAPVAVKFIKSNSIDIQSIIREMRLFDAIGRHDNVLSLFGVCTDAPGGDLVLVMEFCELGSVESWLKRELLPNHEHVPTKVCIVILALYSVPCAP